MGKLLLTRDCECKVDVALGQKRPAECEHGNRLQTEAELTPRPRAALRRVSKKRQAEQDAGARPRSRSTLKPGKGFSASKAQREKVRGMPCVACGRMESFAIGEGVLTVDPAHLWPRSKGGCSSADCVIPLCRICHRAFDQGELDLLPRLADSEAWQVEQAHPILAHGVSPVELVRRLSGGSYEFVKVQTKEAA